MSYNCMGSTLLERTRSRLVPSGNSGQQHVPQGDIVKAAKEITRADAFAAARDIGIVHYKGKALVGDGPLGERVTRRSFVAAFRKAHRSDGVASGMPDINTAAKRLRAGYVPQNTNSSLTMTAGGNLAALGAVPLDPLRPKVAPLWTPAWMWQRRAYGTPPRPGLSGPPSGLGIAIGDIFGAAGGSGGSLSLISSFLPKSKTPEQKAAEAQAKAAQAQARAAKLGLQAQTEASASRTKLLLIGGGVAVAGLAAWLLLRKKG